MTTQTMNNSQILDFINEVKKEETINGLTSPKINKPATKISNKKSINKISTNINMVKKIKINQKKIKRIRNPITNKLISIKSLSKKLRDKKYNQKQIQKIQEKLKENNLGYNTQSGRVSKSDNIKLKKQIKIDIKKKVAVDKISNFYKKSKEKYYIVNNDTGDIARLNKENHTALYQSFEIPKKIIPSNDLTLPKINIKFTNQLDNDTEYKLLIAYEAILFYSGDDTNKQDLVNRNGTVELKVKISELNEKLNLFIYDKYSPISIKALTLQITSQFTEQKFSLNDMVLREAKPLNLCNLYNEVIENKDGKCISNYLSKIYNKFSKKEILKLKTTNDILEYCKKNNIKMIAYDISGNIISSNYPTIKNKSRKSLIFIAYNNHLYPLKNETLKKVSQYEKKEHTYVKNIIEKFENIIDSEIMPSSLKLSHDGQIQSFISDNKHYHSNEEYDVCNELLIKFGLQDQMSIYTTTKNIGEIISKLYIKSNINSFIPENHLFTKGAFNYNNEENVLKNNMNNDDDELITIDKNKCYSYILKELDYLINCDVKKHRTNIINEYLKKDKITDHYLYIVNPVYSSILLPYKNIYSGKHLKYCLDQNIKFLVCEELHAEKSDNYFKQMILDLYDKCDDKVVFKNIVNIMIGKFEKYSNLKKCYSVDKICNEDEIDTADGHKIQLYNEYYALMKKTENFDIFNKKPISIQVKDESRVVLYKTMKKLELNYNDIIQVKTDSITFLNTKSNKNYLEYINDSLDGWKLEEYSKIENPMSINKSMTFIYEKKINDNIIGNCYAGAGKTYKIINQYLTKEIIENGDYIVLTPSHSTLKTYKKKGYNCDVIQKYTLNNKIPSETLIIIDEIGMIDGASWNLLFKMKLLKKTIYGYGDQKQLLPVGSDKDFFNQNFLDYMFYNNDSMTTNYRNNFEKKYYDGLINSNDKSYIINECKKYSTKNYYDSEVIIAYRNSTRHKYNKLMCEKLGIKNKYDIGAKLICTTNDNRKMGIYNKFTYEVTGRENDNIIISDGECNIHIDIDKIQKDFDYSYCRTLYSVQGETLKSYHYPEEDLFFINNRSAYTLISRIKQEKTLI